MATRATRRGRAKFAELSEPYAPGGIEPAESSRQTESSASESPAGSPVSATAHAPTAHRTSF
jgi:hypothetical protein